MEYNNDYEELILTNKITNKMIGLDRDSGGYPFDTEMLSQVHIFNDLEELRKYNQMFGNIYQPAILTYRIGKI